MKGEPHAGYGSDDEVEELVRGFESCELPPAEFNHREHLLVALCYLRRMGDAEALTRLRAAIGRYAAAHSVNPSLYHETVTVFWLKRVRAFVEREGGGAGLAALANRVGAECGTSGLVREYYSEGLLDSAEARRVWREPDLKPLDF
jgi:hypothetical protein